MKTKPQSRNEQKTPKTLKEKIVENLKIILSAYLIAFVLRVTCVEAYQIPTESMVPSLLIGDIYMIEKISMGNVLPMVHWKLPGFATPQRNDIVVFVSPEWKSPGLLQEIVTMLSFGQINLDNTIENPKNLVKRIIALPGDTVSMSNQRLIVNGENPEYSPSGLLLNKKYYETFEERSMGKSRIVQHIKGLSRDEYGMGNPLIFDFAPIRVPKKGDTIALKEVGFHYKELMKQLIERETGKTVTHTRDNRLLMDNREIDEWTASQNYYFGMGDNRDESYDCRYFGFIPEQNIFGRILFRYFPFQRFTFDPNENFESIRNLKI